MVLSKSIQMVISEVKFPAYENTFIVSFMYALNYKLLHKGLWSELVDLSKEPSGRKT